MVQTYAGDTCLVTVAGYDGSFAADSSYDDYGIVYNDRTQVIITPARSSRKNDFAIPLLLPLVGCGTSHCLLFASRAAMNADVGGKAAGGAGVLDSS